jgi:hypothetical protein
LQIRRGNRLCWGTTCQQYDLPNQIKEVSVTGDFFILSFSPMAKKTFTDFQLR